MKLHIPVLLRKALLACFAVGTLYSGGTTAASDLTLGSEDTLSINYAESDSIPDLENGTLRLNGDTLLHLAECGEGNGKTYTLLTGVSGLLDKDGNAITLDSSNNAASLYFDASQPGTGFWADATLLLNANGTLQLVRYTDISIPSGYREVLVYDVSDITYYSSYATDVAFRITQDLKISGRSSSLMTSSDGSWYFTSDSVEHLASLTFSNATSNLFDVAPDEKLEFSRLERVEFSGNKASSSYYYAFGGAIYGGENSTITLSNNGSVTFSGNTASSSSSYAFGGAIYGDYYSTIELSGNGSVEFSGNTASSSSAAYGGAIYGHGGGTITLNGNGSVTFSGNRASSSSDDWACGGAISGSTITLNGNGSATFSGNTASSSSSYARGGAIYGYSGSTIELNGNGSVTFSGNRASSSSSYAFGGAIYGDYYSTIELSGNGSVAFSGNTVSSSSYAYGGAIYGHGGGTITLNGNGSVTFSGNTVSSSSSSSYVYGGAIYGDNYSTITLNDNGSVEFSGNTAFSSGSYSSEAYGGAIYGGENSTITLRGNESVTFSENTAESSYSSYGGAIYGRSNSTITLSNNGSVTFSGNTARYGGAIYGGTITLSGNESVEFGGNGASYYGGAISGSTITLSGNESVEFSGNGASYYGGAISGSTITLSDNGSVTFSGNTAYYSAYSSEAYGGAIYGGSDSTITLSDNGSVTFSGNTVSSYSSSEAYGGAIYGGSDSTITLSNNGSVTFSGNWAYDDGGAIYACGNLDIRNNNSVLFEKNAEVRSGTYRLRSIYAGGSGDTISLSAAEGKSIEFRDAVYIVSGSTVELNADYTDETGVVHKQSGDILFTGKYTESHLNELLEAAGEGRMATELEILNSRTTEVYAMTLLYGGRLRVEDGAVFQGCGLTATEGSSATVMVQNAELSHSGYALRFHSGTVLELGEASSVSGDLHMSGGSVLRLSGGDILHNGALSVYGDVEIEWAEKIELQPGNQMQSFTILRTNGDTRDWNPMSVDLSSLDMSSAPEGYLVASKIDWDSDNLNLKVLTTDTVNWSNAAGDGMWNNASANWEYEGFSFNSIQGITNVVLGETAQGRISLSGDIAVGNIRVEAGCDYNLVLTEGSTLQLTGGGLILERGSSLQLGTGISITTLDNEGSLSVAGDFCSTQGINGDGVLSIAGNLIAGNLSAASLSADSLRADSLTLTDVGAANTVQGDVSVTNGINISGSLSAGGAVSGTEVTVGGTLSASTLTADKLTASALTLTEATGDSRVEGTVTVNEVLDVAGNLTVGGAMLAASVDVGGMLSASSLAAEKVQADTVFLTAEDTANSVSGNLTADAVSLVSGASLEVGGTLTTAEVALQGTAEVLRAGAFGADAMNFVLDRAALESLNLSYDETGTIAQANTAMGNGFTATLNGGTEPVKAAAYEYNISVNGGAVQLTADYVHDGLQVWYRSGWVGQSDWTDFYIAGYDAVNGVETIELNGRTVEGDNLFIAYEDDVRSSVVKNGTLEFAYVDMGGGQFELGENATMTTDELYGKGETLVMHQGSVLEATELTLGTLALEGGELTVKKATINAMSGTEGTLKIKELGQVTVKSDVTLTGLENLGTLKLGTNNLTVNALVDVGGNVTAGEVAVQSRGSRMASFDELVADKVTVVNNLSAGRYTDDLSVGDGSAIGELVAETLEVREGTVTLGRTDGETTISLLNLDLQEDAALVLNQQTSLSVTDELSATEGAEVRLKKQASVSYGDLSIGNRGAATQVVVNAAELADGELSELSNAHMALSGSEDRSIDYKLTNSSVENTGSGKLYVTHEENTLSAVHAVSGDITVMNQALGLELDELVVGNGATFSAYSGDVELPVQETMVSVSESVVFGAGAHINADLKLQSGVRVEMNGPVSMGSDLYLFTGMTLDGAMLESLTSAEQGQTVVLFSGIDRLYLCGEEQTDAIALSHGVSASEYFVNLISSAERGYYLVYDNAEVGNGVLSVTVSGLAVPEPTTATLSLLALAALAARRRRK